MPPIITDICLVAEDVDAAIDFYVQRLDYELESRMPGFADFRSHEGPTLAVWSGELIRTATGVPAATTTPSSHGVMVAVELDSPEAVDRRHEELVARGVEFYGPPVDHAWNARCAYFAGPCGEFWELFAWHDGGKPGMTTEAVTA